MKLKDILLTTLTTATVFGLAACGGDHDHDHDHDHAGHDHDEHADKHDHDHDGEEHAHDTGEHGDHHDTGFHPHAPGWAINTVLATLAVSLSLLPGFLFFASHFKARDQKSPLALQRRTGRRKRSTAPDSRIFPIAKMGG